METVGGLDAGFLAFEGPGIPLQVLGVQVFAAEPALTYERVLALVEERLHLVPPFRRRPVSFPFGLRHPLWVEDPQFALERHVRRAHLPTPGGDAELADWVASQAERPLERDRPLWELYVLEGLAGGQVAIVSKIHHALLDGMSAASLVGAFFDLSEDPRQIEPPKEPWAPEWVPSESELLLESITRAPEHVGAIARAVRDSTATLRTATRWLDPRSVPRPPKTLFNAHVTSPRRVAFSDIELARLKSVGRSFGVTLNDMLLGVVAGALRFYLDEYESLPEEPLLAMVPFSVRRSEDNLTLGNQVASMMVPLATHIDDPRQRIGAIAAATAQIKAAGNSKARAQLTASWAEATLPALATRASRLIGNLRLFDRMAPPCNLIISNVRGPEFPIYAAGARLEKILPLGPLAPGIGLNVTAFSYLDRLFLGTLVCRDFVEHPEVLAELYEHALDELAAAVAPKRRLQAVPGRGAFWSSGDLDADDGPAGWWEWRTTRRAAATPLRTAG